MMFPSQKAESRRILGRFKELADVIANVRNSVMHDVFTFQTDPEWFRRETSAE